MDIQNKYCENCKHFKDEGVDGFGFCVVFKCIHHCTGGGMCVAHQFNDNGWTEITPENEHELTDELIDRVVIGWRDSCNRQHIVAFADCAMGVGTMVKYGGYYYYVLPELKIE